MCSEMRCPCEKQKEEASHELDVINNVISLFRPGTRGTAGSASDSRNGTSRRSSVQIGPGSILFFGSTYILDVGQPSCGRHARDIASSIESLHFDLLGEMDSHFLCVRLLMARHRLQ